MEFSIFVLAVIAWAAFGRAAYRHSKAKKAKLKEKSARLADRMYSKVSDKIPTLTDRVSQFAKKEDYSKYDTPSYLRKMKQRTKALPAPTPTKTKSPSESRSNASKSGHKKI